MFRTSLSEMIVNRPCRYVFLWNWWSIKVYPPNYYCSFWKLQSSFPPHRQSLQTLYLFTVTNTNIFRHNFWSFIVVNSAHFIWDNCSDLPPWFSFSNLYFHQYMYACVTTAKTPGKLFIYVYWYGYSYSTFSSLDMVK